MQKILALDDEQSIVEFIKKALDKKGYETFIATEAGTFFRLFREQEIDLVLLDICMPEKNGFEVFKELRRNKHPPVLFVTADLGSFSVESKMAMDLWQNEFTEGTADIIYKPFDVATLHEKVLSLIGGAEAV